MSPDGPPDPGLVDELLRRALAGPTVRVPPDRSRRELSFPEIVARLRAAAPPGLVPRSANRLDYTLDAGPRVRLIVLDIVRRGGGSGGLVDPAQPAWLAGQLAGAGERWVVVITHQPLTSSAGGEALLALLDRSPRVIAVLNGHTHRNQVTPRRTAAGGYWLIATASLIDYPQQARALRIRATRSGGVAIETWMLDHAGDGRARRDRPPAVLPGRSGRPAAGLRRRAHRSQRDPVPPAARVSGRRYLESSVSLTLSVRLVVSVLPLIVSVSVSFSRTCPWRLCR